MSFLTLYLLMLKATLSSFSGLASLPVLREDFVVQASILSDRQLNTALVAGRITPGPKGLYIVSLGYYAGGNRGLAAAWLALVTPALLVIPLLVWAGRRARSARAQRVLHAVVLASAGISLSATLPLAADALHGPLGYAIAAGSLLVLLTTDIETVWMIAAGAVAMLLGGKLGWG